MEIRPFTGAFFAKKSKEDKSQKRTGKKIQKRTVKGNGTGKQRESKKG
jgi:hypothetical protein